MFIEREEEANLIMNKLLVSVRPSEALVNKIDNYLSKFSFDLDDFKNLSKKVIKHIRKVQFDKDQKEEKYAERTFSCQNFELRIILVDESS